MEFYEYLDFSEFYNPLKSRTFQSLYFKLIHLHNDISISQEKTDDKKGKKDKNQIMSNQRSQTNEFPDKSDMWVTSPFPPNP
jgi:hypothetical protein